MTQTFIHNQPDYIKMQIAAALFFQTVYSRHVCRPIAGCSWLCFCLCVSLYAFLFLRFLFPHIFACATRLLFVCLCAFVCLWTKTTIHQPTALTGLDVCFSFIVVSTVHIVNSHQTLKCESNINHRLEDITADSSFPLTFDLKSTINELHVVHAAVGRALVYEPGSTGYDTVCSTVIHCLTADGTGSVGGVVAHQF